MKTLAQKPLPPEDTFWPEHADENKYYGIFTGEHRAFIYRTEYGGGMFKFMLPKGVTVSNGLSEFSNKTVKGLITDVQVYNETKYKTLFKIPIFEFDTWEELFKWLLKLDEDETKPTH